MCVVLRLCLPCGSLHFVEIDGSDLLVWAFSSLLTFRVLVDAPPWWRRLRGVHTCLTAETLSLLSDWWRWPWPRSFLEQFDNLERFGKLVGVSGKLQHA